MDPHTPYQLAAFVLSIFLVHVFKSPAHRLRLLDYPGGRKTHEHPVPLIGGIAIFGAFCFSALLLPGPLRPFSSLFAGMGILLIAGILDDLNDISARSKLAAQTIAALIMAASGGESIKSLGNLFGTGEILLGDWSIPFTVLCTVGLINAINMADGLDGLASGLIVVALAWLTYIAHLTGAHQIIPPITLLLAATLGFMLFNFRFPWRRRATVFLGDNGSMMLGFAIAWFSIDISQGPHASGTPIAIAWILAIPVFDTVSLMARRMRKGLSPFAADREHLHHILLRAGYRPCTSVNILIAIAILMGAVGTIGWYLGISEFVLLLLLLAVFSGHLYFVLRAWRMTKSLKRLRRWRKRRRQKSADPS